MKTLNKLKRGDKIKINSKPTSWASEFSFMNPLEADFKYPIIGIVKNRKDGFNYIPLLIEINGIEYGFSEESLLDVCELLPKFDKLPEEYIVECKCREETKAVMDVIHKVHNWYHWQYVVKCFKINAGNNVNIYMSILEEHKHLPVLSFNEWKELYESSSKPITDYYELKELKEKLEAELNVVNEDLKNSKPNYKVGDIVMCLPGFKNMCNCSNNVSTNMNYGGAGYESGLVFEIISIDDYSPSRNVLWRNSLGVYDNAVRYATQKEIESYNRGNITISGYDAKIFKNENFVKFGCKSITLRELEAILTVMELNKKFEFAFLIGLCNIKPSNGNEFEQVSKEIIEKLINLIKK
jgi:hypothetical protein